jgi:hypothetical protein
MATEKSPKNVREINLAGLIAKVKELGPSTYSNHMQCLITSHEIFLDFYSVTPNPNADNVEVKHVQRIILPLDLGKGTATALANVIAIYEEDHHITLPSSRSPQEDDKITIWT